MGLILLVGLGAILGWLSAIIAGTRTDRGLQINILTGIVGAVLVGLIVNPLIGAADIFADSASAMALMIAAIGAAALLATVNLLRNGELR